MKNARLENVEFSCQCGCEIAEAVSEVFWWFYTGEGKNADKTVIRHLNGIKVTFEREP
jgi:hypothetical protein